MGLVKRLLGEDALPATDGYLDLAEYAAELPESDTSTLLKVAELTRYEDLGNFTDFVYEGNVLILDFTPIAKDEITLKRIVNDLRKVAGDVKGDVAGIGDHLIVVTPNGIRVDRRKLRVATA